MRVSQADNLEITGLQQRTDPVISPPVSDAR